MSGLRVLGLDEMESEVVGALGQLGREPTLDEVVPSPGRQCRKRPINLGRVN